MPMTTTRITEAELDRILREARRAQAQVLADLFRWLTAATRRAAATAWRALRVPAPGRRYGA
jgi:hypothetical protein